MPSSSAHTVLAEAVSAKGMRSSALAEHSPRGVRALRVGGVYPEQLVEPLARFHELEALVLDVVPLTGELLAVVAGRPRLRALVLPSSRGALVPWTGGFAALELLSLPFLDFSLAPLEPFLRGLPRLRSLDLHAAQMTSLPVFVRELAALRELDLRSVPVPDDELAAFRAARPDVAVRTSPVNLGWAPGIRGVLRVSAGFPVRDMPLEDDWVTGTRVRIADRHLTFVEHYQLSPADYPDYFERVHGPMSVETFVVEGPPLSLTAQQRAELQRWLEAELDVDATPALSELRVASPERTPKVAATTPGSELQTTPGATATMPGPLAADAKRTVDATPPSAVQTKSSVPAAPPTRASVADPVEAALRELHAALWSIGEAYSALDHGYVESSDQLFAEVPGRLRAAWARAPDDLAVLLPAHADVLAAGTVTDGAWSSLADVVSAALAKHLATRQ